MADPWLEGINSNQTGPTEWADYPKALGSGIAGLLSDQGAGLRALSEEGDSEDKFNRSMGYLGEAIQGTFGDLEVDAVDSMSPAAKKQIQSTMTDPEFWKLSSMGLKGVQMSPSIAAVAIPSYILSGIGLGAATTAVVGGELSATAVIDEMYKATDSLTDADLQAQVPIYKEMRDNGSDEEEARREYNKVIRGLAPVYAAGIGAIANTLGVGGQVARGLSGKAAGIAAGAEAGIVRRTVGGAAEGALGGAIDAGGEDYLIQQGTVDGDLKEGIDYGQVAQSAGTGAALGAVFGAPAGAIFHGGHDRPTGEGVPEAEPVDVAGTSASGAQSVPGVPDPAVAGETPVPTTTAPTTEPTADPYAGMTPRQKRDALANNAFENPEAAPTKGQPVQVVAPTGPDAAMTDALTATQPPAPITSEGNPPSPLPPSEALAPTSIPQEVGAPSIQAAPRPEPVAAPEPVRAPEAAPVAQPDVLARPSAQETAGNEVRGPVPSSGPRILQDVSPEGRKASTQAAAQWGKTVAKNMKEPAEEPVGGKNFTKTELAAREAVRQGSKAITEKYPPAQGETNLYSKKPAEVVAARKSIADRVQAISDEVDASDFTLPQKLKDAAADAYNPETLLAMEAKRLHSLIRAKKATPKDYDRFARREYDIRSGAMDEALRQRREEGDIASRGGGDSVSPDDIIDSQTGNGETNQDFYTPEEQLIRAEEEGSPVTKSSRGETDETAVPKSIDDALTEALFSTPKERKAPIVVEKRKLGRIIKMGEKTAPKKPANGNTELPPKLKQVQENIAKAREIAEREKADNAARAAKAKEMSERAREANQKAKDELDNLAKTVEEVRKKSEESAAKSKTVIDSIKEANRSFQERVAKAREATDTAPTDAQKEAGNYKKGTVSIHGNEIAIENPKGSERSGVTSEGNGWKVKMPVDYGYLKGTKGADGDAIDVFVGPNHDVSHVYVIDQIDPDTRVFDEHKVMMGFKSEQSAITAYDRSFSDGQGAMRVGNLTRMTMDEFKEWKSKPQAERAAGTSYLDEAEARLTPAEEQAAFYESVATGKPPEGIVKNPTARQFARPVRSGTASEFMWGADLADLKGMQRVMAGTARNVLTKLIGDTPVHILSRADMARFSGRADDGSAPLPYGFYAFNGPDHGIFVREDLLNNPAKLRHTVWHEATHAATLKQIMNDRDTRRSIERVMYAVNDALSRMDGDQIVRDLRHIEYGMTSPEEFVAEVFSKPEFQDVLSRMQAPPRLAKEFGLGAGVKTMWDALVSSVRRALGMPAGTHSLLEAAIRVTERSMHMSNIEYEGRAERRFLSDPDEKTTASDIMKAARERVGLPDLAPTKGNPHLLGLRTFDNIARAADRYFGGNNPVRKIANVIEQQRVAAARKIDAASPMINKLHGLQKKYAGKQWEDFTSLVHDETMAGVFADRDLASQKHITKEGGSDAWAREQHKDLAARWASLPADLKAARTEAMKYFTDAQNELAYKLIRNRIVTLFDTADPDGLAKRVHEGTVTDADKALMGEAYDAIAQAGSLSKIDGPYFPLMRRGNYVVKGTYKVTPPKDATAISANEFEFKSKEAATKFAASQDGRPTLRTIYVDKNTGATHGTEEGKQYRYTKEDIDAEPRYRVAVQDRHMEMFDTMDQARARVQELRAAGIDVDDAVPRAFENYGIQADALSSHMRRLSTVMERRADARSYTPEQKDDLLRTLNEVSLSMLGSTRIQSRNLPRRYVAGASKDLLRNTVEYAHATGNYSAKLDYRPQLDGAISEMNDFIKANGKDQLSAGRQMIANEVMRRVTTPNPVSETTTFNAVTNRILSLSFMDKLMSPTYSVINATQPMMTTTPYLAGQYGIGRAYTAMAKAYADVGVGKALGQGFKDTMNKVKGNLQGNDPVTLIMSRLKDKGEMDMMNILLDRGIIDSDSGLEVSQLVRDQRKIVGALDGGIGHLEGIGRQFPKTVEAINRSVSALAAYRLEMERSGDHARAVQFAQDTVNMTQFNYSSSNSAPWMKHPMARLAFQFKKYGQGMYQLLGEQMAIAIRNEAPGDRVKAIKSLSMVLGTHALMAGVMGLPTEPIKLAVLAANGLGITDWGWGDVEDAEREALASVFGKQFGEMVARGVTRGIGIDLSSRMGLDTMVGPFGEPRSNEAQDWKAYAWDSFAGAPAGMLADWGGGIASMAQGDFLRGAEKLIPIKAAADMIKAYRGATEGNVSQRTGKQTMSPYSAYETGIKAIGFAPAREAEGYEASSSFYRAKTQQEDARRSFQREWVESNGAARGRLWREVQKWNKTVAPEARLSISDMRTYQRKMESDIKNTQEGIRAKRREKTLQKNVGKTYDYLPR